MTSFVSSFSNESSIGTFDDLGTFVAIQPSPGTLDVLLRLQEAMHFSTPVSRDQLHCTIVDSQTTLHGFEPFGDIWPSVRARSLRLVRWPWLGDQECVVLVIDSEDIMERHLLLRSRYNIPTPEYEYVPHVTLAYGTGNDNLLMPSDSVIHTIAPSLSFTREYSIGVCGAVRDYIIRRSRND